MVYYALPTAWLKAGPVQQLFSVLPYAYSSQQNIFRLWHNNLSFLYDIYIVSTTIKHILLTLLLFFACFGGHEAVAIPVSAGELVQQEEGIAPGELYTWPGALPELERSITAQAPPATPLKQHSNPGLGGTAEDREHWLQQGIARQVAMGQLCQASLSGIRIIFPFHYFW